MKIVSADVRGFGLPAQSPVAADAIDRQLPSDRASVVVVGQSEPVAQPVVSVVMPVRNEERFVEAAIAAVLAQEIPLELLIMDGGSTDRTADLVRKVGDHRVHLFANPAQTIPAALNIGLANARGAFVARIDAHAKVNPEYLALGLRHLEDPGVAAVGGIRLAVASTPTGKAIAAALSSRFGVGNSINHYADQAQDTDHASFGIYRTEVLNSVGGWDEGLLVNEDVDIDHRILAAGHRIRFDPAMEIHWQVRETLPQFARQYRRYGRGKAGMVRKNGRSAVRLRHLVAPAVTGVLGLAGASALIGKGRWALLATAPYVAAIAGATVMTKRNERTEHSVNVPTLALTFPTMHLAWGTGFLEGMFLGRAPAAATARDPRDGRRRRDPIPQQH